MTFDDNFIKKSKLKRYKRLYSATKDHQWALKFAQEEQEEIKESEFGKMHGFVNPPIFKFVEHLVYGNTMPESDEVQKELGLAVAKGLQKFYQEHVTQKSPALIDWRYGDPEEVLNTRLLISDKQLPEVKKFVLEGASQKVQNIVSNNAALRDAIRYALIRGYSSFYRYFLFANPLASLLPNANLFEVAGEGDVELALAAREFEKKISIGARAKRTTKNMEVRTKAGPRLDDYIKALKLQQVELLKSFQVGDINEKTFSRFQAILVGKIDYAERGLKALKEFMSSDENQDSRFYSSRGAYYRVQINPATGKPETPLVIADKLAASIPVMLNHKKNAEVDFDNLQEGDEVYVNVNADLLTDNMYIGNFVGERGIGKSGLAGMIRNNMNWPPKEVSDYEKKSEDFAGPTFKDWKGEYKRFSTPLPDSAELAIDFTESVIAENPDAYKVRVKRGLQESAVTYLRHNFSKSISSDVTNAISSFMQDDGKTAQEVVKVMAEAMVKGIEQAQEAEELVSDESYANIKIAAIDEAIRASSALNEDKQALSKELARLTPDSLSVGKSDFVIDDTGKSKMGRKDVNDFYKRPYGGVGVAEALIDHEGKFAEKYASNAEEYESWNVRHGTNEMNVEYRKAIETKDLIDNDFLEKLGISSRTREEFTEDLFNFIKECRKDFDNVKDKLGDVSHHALFAKLSQRFNLFYEEEIATSIYKQYTNEREEFAPSDEDGAMESGRSESPEARARRLAEMGYDIKEFYSQQEKEMYSSFDRNGNIRTISFGGELEDLIRSPSDSIEDLMSKDSVGSFKGQMFNAMRNSFGKRIQMRNQNLVKEMLGNKRDEVMEVVGAFADPIHSHKNLVNRREQEELLENLEASYQMNLNNIKELEGIDNPTEEQLKTAEELGEILKNTEVKIKSTQKRISRLNFDTPYNSLRRAFSQVGRHGPDTIIDKIREYFKNKRDEIERVDPKFSRFIIPFSRDNAAVSSDPFRHERSNIRMSPSLFLSAFNVGELAANKIISKEVNSIAGSMRKLSPIGPIPEQRGMSDENYRVLLGSRNEREKAVKEFISSSEHSLRRIKNEGATAGINALADEIKSVISEFTETGDVTLTSEQAAEKHNGILDATIELLKKMQQLLAEAKKESEEAYQAALAQEEVLEEPIEVNSPAAAIVHIENEMPISYSDKVELEAAIETWPEEAINTDTEEFYRTLSDEVQEKKIDIQDAQSLFVSQQRDIPEAALDQAAETFGPPPSPPDVFGKVDVFMVKYQNLLMVDTESMTLPDLLAMQDSVNRAVSEATTLGDELVDAEDDEDLTPEMRDKLEQITKEFDTLDDVINGLSSEVDRLVDDAVEDMPLSEVEEAEQEVEEEEAAIFELTEEEILQDDEEEVVLTEEDLELEEEVVELSEEDLDDDTMELSDEGFELIEEEPAPNREFYTDEETGLQFTRIEGYEGGIRGREVVEDEDGKSVILDDKNDIKYFVVPEVESGWHGIVSVEDITEESVPEPEEEKPLSRPPPLKDRLDRKKKEERDFFTDDETGLQFTKLEGYEGGIRGGEVIKDENGKFVIIDDKNDIKYFVAPEAESDWHGIISTEDIVNEPEEEKPLSRPPPLKDRLKKDEAPVVNDLELATEKLIEIKFDLLQQDDTGGLVTELTNLITFLGDRSDAVIHDGDKYEKVKSEIRKLWQDTLGPDGEIDPEKLKNTLRDVSGRIMSGLNMALAEKTASKGEWHSVKRVNAAIEQDDDFYLL